MKGKGEKGNRSSFNSSQTDDGTLSFTTLKSFDYAKSCPIFTSIASRDEDDIVSTEELDVLQPELESILTCLMKRVKSLQTELQNLSLEKGKEKHGSSPSGTLTPQSSGSMSSSVEHNHMSTGPHSHMGTGPHKRSGKGKEERPAKRMRTDSGRATYAQPITSKGKGKNHPESSESSSTKAPKNITPIRFWAMVEPYCSEITKEDLRFLEEQIKFCEDVGEVMSVPKLGKGRIGGCEMADVKRKGHPIPVVDESFNKNCGDQEGPSSLYGPLTQRLVQALLEIGGASNQDFTISDAEAMEAATIPVKHLAKQLRMEDPSDIERRIKRELHDQGIFDSEDSDDDASSGNIENGNKLSRDVNHNINNNNGDDDDEEDDEEDEVLIELRKKQNELKHLSSKNCQILRGVLEMAKHELVKQELRKDLMAADVEVEEAYKKLQVCRVKKKTPNKKERDAFFKAIQDRKSIMRQLHAPHKQTD